MIDIVITYALIATGITANKFLLGFMAPDFFIGLRMFIAGLLLFVYVIKDSPRLRWSYMKHDAFLILFISLCTTLIPAILKAFSLKYMPASKTTLLGSIDPFITAVYAYILWQERLNFKKVTGMIIGLIGVIVCIMSNTLPAEYQWGEFLYISYPEIAIFISVAISRYGWILVQMMMKKNRYTPVEINSLTMTISGFLALLISLSRGSYAVSTPTPFFVTVFIYTIVIGNIWGYTAYSHCLKRHNATFMSLAGFLVPLFVALFARILGQEKFTISFFVSAALLLCGLVVFYSDSLARSWAQEKELQKKLPESE